MKLSLNLASRVYVNRRALMTSYLVVSVLLLLLLGLNLSNLLRTQTEAEKIGGRIAELKRAGARASVVDAGYSPQAQVELNKLILFANTLLERDDFRWTELLDQLEESTPDGISIRSIQPEYISGAVKLSGVAESNIALRRFLDQLAASPHFNKVLLFQLSNVQGVKTGDGAGLSFNIGLHRVEMK